VHALHRSNLYYSYLANSSVHKGVRECPRPSELFVPDAVCQGYLTKQGGKLKTWKRRYCVLLGGSHPAIYYFKLKPKSNSCAPKRSISLLNAQVMPAHEKISKQNCFVVLTPNRNFFLQTDVSEEYDVWLKMIRNVIKACTRRRLVNFRLL
jgi:hypothetical protein